MTTAALGFAVCFSACGEYYRPVAQPIEGIQPSPAAAHSIFAINTDGIASNDSGNGSASNIDASGDSIQGNLMVGLAPAYAAVLPDGAKLYVANSADDSVTVNTTTSPTTVAATVSLPPSPFAQITAVSGNGTTATYTYSGTGVFSAGDTVYITGCSTSGFDGVYVITAASGNTFSVANSTSATDSPEFPGAQAKTPNAVFVNAGDNNNVYVAGYATDSVFAISAANNAVSSTLPVGLHPVALAELPNAQQLYVANEGSGTVSVISTATTDSIMQTIPLAGGAVPVWVVAKPDSSRVFVLDASGIIYDLNPLAGIISCTTAPAVGCFTTASANAGVGSNFLTFDPVLNRLYVSNPTNSQIAILDASVDPPKLLNTINLATAAAGVCTSCAPDSITVLGDGSRAYVAAYQFAPGCTDASGNPVNCVDTLVAVIDGPSATLKSMITSIGSGPALSTTGCGPGSGPAPTVWQPGTARFRQSITSSGGGTNSTFKVYVAQCDAGSVAVIDTYAANGNPPDSYSGVSITPPLSTFPPLAGVPQTQNPVLVIAGP